jgi:quinol monooxygenase YgiN
VIREIATLTIDPAREAAFLAAVTEARAIFAAAPGCHGMRLDRVIETPGVYHLVVDWETVAHHTEGFRNSDAFQRWRGLAGPFFVQPPAVVHSETVVV